MKRDHNKKLLNKLPSGLQSKLPSRLAVKAAGSPERDGNGKRRPRGRISGRLGVKWKLFGFLALFTALILVILWLCQVVFLEDIYKSTKINEIRLSARTLVANIDSDKFEDRAKEIAAKKRDVRASCCR